MSTSQPATTAAVSDTEIDSVRISESQRVIDAVEAEHEHEREGDESEPFVSDAARGDDRQDEPARHGDDELAGRPVRIAVRGGPCRAEARSRVVRRRRTRSC